MRLLARAYFPAYQGSKSYVAYLAWDAVGSNDIFNPRVKYAFLGASNQEWMHERSEYPSCAVVLEDSPRINYCITGSDDIVEYDAILAFDVERFLFGLDFPCMAISLFV